jgi:hypothetical protein
MPRPIPRLIYGLEPIIAVTALAVATVDAIVVPAAVLLGIVPAQVLSNVAVASAIFTALVFVRLLVSPAFHYAMQQANTAMQGDQPFRLRPPKFGDPEWGLTGQKWGTGYLVPLRLVLFVEFPAVVFFGPHDRQWLAMAAFSGGALTILLTQSQLTDHFRLPVK